MARRPRSIRLVEFAARRRSQRGQARPPVRRWVDTRHHSPRRLPDTGGIAIAETKLNAVVVNGMAGSAVGNTTMSQPLPEIGDFIAKL